MKLKRSTIRHIAVALPAFTLLGLTACSSDDAVPEKEVKADAIALTIPLSSTRGSENATSLMDKMCIATYDEQGHLIETIYKDGEFIKDQSGISAFDGVYELKGETVMSVRLPMDVYEEYTSREIGEHYGIKFAAFYLPEGSTQFQTPAESGETFEVPDNLNKLNTEIESYYTLNFPTEGNEVWQPEDDLHIPMAGVLDVTSAVENYDPALWSENNPMFLNNDPLVLIRSMAKVTIVNGDHFLTGASFKTAVNGTLLPDLTSIVKEGIDTKVNKVTVSTKPEFMADFDSFQKINGEEDEYVFYTFERDFSGLNADDNARKIMTLTWEGHGDQTFSFKNYDTGNLQDPVWQGILRNHSYTFTVKKPENGKVHVDVNVEKWSVLDYEDTY